MNEEIRRSRYGVCGACRTPLTPTRECPHCKLELRKREMVIRRVVPAQEVVDAARQTLDWPFVHQGRSSKGIDCIGLLFHVGVTTKLVENLNPPEYWFKLRYNRRPTTYGADSHWLLRELRSSFRRIPVSEVQCSDIVYCRDQRWVHVGIVTPDQMIHAYAADVNRVCEHPYDVVWKARTVAAFGWPGVIY